MSWANSFKENVESAEFEHLPGLFIDNTAFYGRIKLAVDNVREKVASYSAGGITEEELFAWVKTNMANKDTIFARLLDTKPNFRHCSFYPWYSSWFANLLSECSEDVPKATPTKRGRKKA